VVDRILAIDPGNVESGWCVIDADDRDPIHFAKEPNERVRQHILTAPDFFEADHVVVEMVASYGMAVGKEVFETCLWIGRFCEAIRGNWYPHSEPRLVYRRDVKLHHCGTSKAKDANVRQALVDRFAAGQPNHGKGTKGEPGWFHGFVGDVWQAYALAVYAADALDDAKGAA
jgi:hypothetical protein